MRRGLVGMTDRKSQAEYDIFRDDGTVPGGGAPVKTGVREADLKTEKELQEESLTEEEKRVRSSRTVPHTQADGRTKVHPKIQRNEAWQSLATQMGLDATLF
jgi:hypothetical protein